MGEFLASMFGAMEDGSMWESVKGIGKELGSDGSMIGGVMSALRIAGGHGQVAHSQSNATPYHFTTNANVDTVLNHEASYMKNDINVGQGFNSLKNLF
ncbi:hypothetical protein [Klebsiella variicola]|uniref:hypothetical protein n=1 Tax=Klebsiella variicola TaxID=244366 RepID=UPI003D02C9F8